MSRPMPAELVKRYGIALTGGIATGKSTVAAMIARRGFLVIDADQLARAVTAKGSAGLAAVAAEFGVDVVTSDGTLDRARLGAIVFADPQRRRRLEAIMHPLIRQALVDALLAAGLADEPRPFFYEAALIFETGTQGDFRAVWATVCAPAVQKARLMARSSLSPEAAERLITQQMPAAEKARRADVVIRTDGSPAEVESQVATQIDLLTPVPGAGA